MDSQLAEPVFSSTEAVDEFDHRKPLRISSVTALLLGLMSVVAPLAPFLWCIPALAIIAACVALRPAKIGDAGRGAAVAGLSLALFFGGWAVAEKRTARGAQIETARAFAVDWLDSFKTGETEFCYEMTLAHDQRNYEMHDLKKLHAPDPEMEEKLNPFDQKPSFSSFFETEEIAELVAAGDKPLWEFLGCQGYFRSHDSLECALRFVDKTQTITRPIDVVLKCKRSDPAVQYWQIVGHSFPDNRK